MTTQSPIVYASTNSASVSTTAATASYFTMSSVTTSDSVVTIYYAVTPNEYYPRTGASTVYTYSVSAQRERTATEAAYYAERRRAQEELQRARQRRIEIGDRRARTLLLSHLEAEQAAQYERERYFEVITRGGNRKYRIHHGLAGNIEAFEGGRLVETLCIHIPSNFPIEDNLLAQKLALEADEEQFRRIANITPIRRAA